MVKDREVWKDDVLEIKTNKKYLKKLEAILEIRVLDLKGNLIMNFWRGEKNVKYIHGHEKHI